MKWLFLACAGVLEVTWACAMKLSNGFTSVAPSVVTVAGYVLSAVFLALALKELPLGTAYAMWTGFGIVGTALAGALLFGERLTVPQLACTALIAAGIAGLKLLGGK